MCVLDMVTLICAYKSLNRTTLFLVDSLNRVEAKRRQNITRVPKLYRYKTIINFLLADIRNSNTCKTLETVTLAKHFNRRGPIFPQQESLFKDFFF
jgi:hypothetical protein